ncbi:MAG: TIGR01457 family HAD-type hydrolase, partial [Armatimonadetes bacterium]|nr:TIGR01457 family HAD-type hydrolase [Armatimonadota bacterium]
ALIVGEMGLREAAVAAGLAIVEGGPAEFVIAGLDRRFSYDRLRAATLAIRGGASFIASNRDPNIPVEEALWPGGGAIVAAIETASGARPIVIGKPETLLFEMAAERAGLSTSDMVMIGDQISTDIDGGERAGMRTVLVLTGVSTAAEAARRPTPPSLIVSDLARLLARWEGGS